MHLPDQPQYIDKNGTLRFIPNRIVSKLLDLCTENGYSMNEIAVDNFTREERVQFAQLIGYSVHGFGTLSYVEDSDWERVDTDSNKSTRNCILDSI